MYCVRVPVLNMGIVELTRSYMVRFLNMLSLTLSTESAFKIWRKAVFS